MAQPNIGELVAVEWQRALDAEPELAWLVTKDGRWFAVWLSYLGATCEQWCRYKSGRYRKATFDVQRDQHEGRFVYRQRLGVGQPRFDFVSPGWIPKDEATADRMEAIKPPRLFASKPLMNLLR